MITQANWSLQGIALRFHSSIALQSSAYVLAQIFGKLIDFIDFHYHSGHYSGTIRALCYYCVTLLLPYSKNNTFYTKNYWCLNIKCIKSVAEFGFPSDVTMCFGDQQNSVHYGECYEEYTCFVIHLLCRGSWFCRPCFHCT